MAFGAFLSICTCDQACLSLADDDPLSLYFAQLNFMQNTYQSTVLPSERGGNVFILLG